MQIPITINKSSGTAIQVQIIAQIRDLIDRGLLASGTRVPSSRELSAQLRVARRTIVLAYDKLVSEGYLESRQSAATFVSALNPRRAIHAVGVPSSNRDAAASTAPSALAGFNNPHLYIPGPQCPKLDFSIGRPDHRLFPQKTWQRLTLENMAAHARVISAYPDPQGHRDLRLALCEHLRATRGITCTEDQIIIVSGAQDGLNLVGRLLQRQSSKVIVEDPCYNGAAAAFETLGMQLVPAPVDKEGIVVGDWPQDANLVYVTPSHQFPYGVTMSLDRRRRLLSWIGTSEAYVVEDDYDSDFRYNSSPLFALKALDSSHRVIYLGTFSKSIGPGLRIGYVVFPEHLASAARDLKATMSNGMPLLEQAVIAQFIRSGAFERHLVVMRRHYLARRDRLISALLETFPGTTVSGAEGGMHLVWSLSPSMPPARELAAACRDFDVGIHPIADSPFCKCFNPPSPRDVMLGYTSLTESQIHQAVECMKHLAKSVARPRLRA